MRKTRRTIFSVLFSLLDTCNSVLPQLNDALLRRRYFLFRNKYTTRGCIPGHYAQPMNLARSARIFKFLSHVLREFTCIDEIWFSEYWKSSNSHNFSCNRKIHKCRCPSMFFTFKHIFMEKYKKVFTIEIFLTNLSLFSIISFWVSLQSRRKWILREIRFFPPIKFLMIRDSSNLKARNSLDGNSHFRWIGSRLKHRR